MKNHYRDASRRKTPWDEQANLSPIEAFIKSKYLDSFQYKHPSLNNEEETKLLNSYSVSCCKRCKSNRIKKQGFTKNGIQRYYCLDCRRTFTIITNTLFEDHKISITEWVEFCLSIFRYESISSTSKSNKNSNTTSKYWLKKLFLILEDIQSDVVLSGNIQIDETFYAVLQKDRIKVNEKDLRGLSRNQFCIGVGYDGKYVYAKVEGHGKPSQKSTKAAFMDHIQKGSHLIHDKEKSHKILVKKLELTEEVYNANELKKLDDKDNPLQAINHQCYLLKCFLNTHSGFDRKDLQNYINLFCFIMNPPDERLEKVKIVLNSAVHLTKSLKYRDAFTKK